MNNNGITIALKTSTQAAALATALIIERSAWFMVTPLPNDEFLFDMKAEHAQWAKAKGYLP